MNLDEVAKLAGVSAATVSRVLNNLDVVRDVTRDRVMRAVSELNYHPNLHARSLAGGKSRTIGMIVSNLENPFFFDIFRTLEADSHANGYEVLAAHTGYSPEQLLRSVRLMIGRRVAGLAVIVSEMAPDLMNELELSRIPTVFYDVGAAKKHISNIRVQYRQGIELLVEHLHSLGHTRLAFIGHNSLLGPTNERERAFVADGVQRSSPPRMAHGCRSGRSGRRAARDGRTAQPRFPADGHYLRQRFHRARRPAGTSRTRIAGSPRCLGDRFRQYPIIRILLSRAHHGTHTKRPDWTFMLSVAGSGLHPGRRSGPRNHRRSRTHSAGFRRPGAVKARPRAYSTKAANLDSTVPSPAPTPPAGRW